MSECTVRREKTTSTYDAEGNHIATREEFRDVVRPRKVRVPVFSRTQEFRLSASRRAQVCTDLPFDVPDDIIVAITAVRVSVARPTDSAEASSPIGGVDVKAELRDESIVCSAEVSDFARGDLVVVQVDLAVYAA